MTDQTRGGNEAEGVVSSSSSDELAMAVEQVFPENDPTNPLHRLAQDIRLKRIPHEIRADLIYALSRLASQEETIRADGECWERT